MLYAYNDKRKKEITEGIELSHEKNIRLLRKKESNKYLGILETDTIKQTRKKKVRYEDLRWARKLLESNVCFRKLIKAKISRLSPL